MSWAATITAVVGAGLSVGMAAASKPEFPNAAASSRKAVLADLSTLPGRRMADMLARLGQEGDVPTGRREPLYETQQVPLGDRRLRLSPTERDRLARSGATTAPLKVQTGWKDQERHVDFTGQGDADVQGELAGDMAQIALDTQKKYGVDFITEAKKQQALADPDGTAARQLLGEEIQRQEAERQDRPRPVADKLDAQLLEELQAGTGVLDDTREQVAAVARRRAAAGDGGLDTAAMTRELEEGAGGEARKLARMQKELSFLSSGATPEDVDYRRRQQSMGNMASFLAGRTPQAQFGALSGAQQGAAPVPRGGALAQVNPNITAQAQGAAVGQYQNAVAQNAGEISPWFAGLSTLIKGAGAASAAGLFGQRA